jgi:hypothetical protein
MARKNKDLENEMIAFFGEEKFSQLMGQDNLSLLQIISWRDKSLRRLRNGLEYTGDAKIIVKKKGKLLHEVNINEKVDEEFIEYQLNEIKSIADSLSGLYTEYMDCKIETQIILTQRYDW